MFQATSFDPVSRHKPDHGRERRGRRNGRLTPAKDGKSSQTPSNPANINYNINPNVNYNINPNINLNINGNINSNNQRQLHGFARPPDCRSGGAEGRPEGASGRQDAPKRTRYGSLLNFALTVRTRLRVSLKTRASSGPISRRHASTYSLT